MSSNQRKSKFSDYKLEKMEKIMISENVIIKGVPQKNKTASRILYAGIILFATSFFLAVLGFFEWMWGDDFLEFYFDYFFSDYYYYGYVLLIGVVSIIVALIIKASTEKCEIIVTDKHVYGQTANGRKVDIPLNQITYIKSCSFHGVSVKASSGVNKFYLLENHEEVMKAISFLLINPKTTQLSAAPVIESESARANDDSEIARLKQAKELLDSGIITEEEFNAKKKLIMGI